MLEVHEGGDAVNPLKQFVWDLRYVDAPVVRFHDADTDGTIDDTLYYTTDANMNVTALLDTGGDAVERYVYNPYGEVTIYDDDWSDTRSASSYDNAILYCGYYHDWETGLYHVRHRVYHAQMGRWLQRDRIGYVDGMGLYEYVHSAPLALGDPLGLVGQYHPGVWQVRNGEWYREFRFDPNTQGWKSTRTRIMEEDYWTKHKGGRLGEYRRVEDCHVVVELSHIWSVDFPMQAHYLDCSAYGHLTCYADSGEKGLNYETVDVEGPHPSYEDRGTKRIPHSGLISGFPEQTGAIGARDDASNAGHGGGKAGFKALLNEAWKKAVRHGKKLAKNNKCCWCEKITVVFWLGGPMGSEVKSSLEVLNTWCQGGLFDSKGKAKRKCREEEISIKQ